MNNELVADALRIEDMSGIDSEEAGVPRAVTYLRLSTSRQAALRTFGGGEARRVRFGG